MLSKSQTTRKKKVCEPTLSDQGKFQQITQQLQEVSGELQKVKNEKSNKLPARRLRDQPDMNCIQDSSQIRCYQCNYLGHTAKFCNDNNQTAKRETTKPSLNQRRQDIYQLTQNVEVQLKKEQIKNCRGLMKTNSTHTSRMMSKD